MNASQPQGSILLVFLLSTELSARIASATMPSSSENVSPSVVLVVLAVPGHMSKLVADKAWPICASHWVALRYYWVLWSIKRSHRELHRYLRNRRELLELLRWRKAMHRGTS